MEEQREIEEEDAAAAQELFCVCQQPDDPEAPRDFVQCDKCQQWFHPECVNTTTQVRAALPLLAAAHLLPGEGGTHHFVQDKLRASMVFSLALSGSWKSCLVPLRYRVC